MTEPVIQNFADIQSEMEIQSAYQELCEHSKNPPPFNGKNVTEKDIKELSDNWKFYDYKVIHFATHGIFEKETPLESAIFLTIDGKADPLTAAKIYENPLPARLVILSACETGLGKTIAGDDLLGLTRSFYLGGAVATLSSLWQIDDEGTMEFMKKFHLEAVNDDYGKAWVVARDYVKGLGYPASVYGAFILGGASN